MSSRAPLCAALAMASQANTTDRLRDRVRERVGADAFDSYLAELEVVEASARRVVLQVGPTLAREAFRRFGPALARASRELFGSRRVVLAGDGEWFDLGAGEAHAGPIPEPGAATQTSAVSPLARRVRQRSGPCGQPGVRERLERQCAFRVPFAVAPSLPRTASQAFARHSPDEPLEYVGRWGRAYSEESLTSFTAAVERLGLRIVRGMQSSTLRRKAAAAVAKE